MLQELIEQVVCQRLLIWGGCIVFYLEALGREGGVLQNMGMKSGFHDALLRDGYFAAVFLF